MTIPSMEQCGIFIGGIIVGGLTVWSLFPDVAEVSRTGRVYIAGDNTSIRKKTEPVESATLKKSNRSSLPAGSRLPQLLEEFSELSSADPLGINTRLVATLRQVLGDNDESRRTLHFNLMLEVMQVQDAPAIAEMFEGLKRQGLEFDPEANFFAQRWGELDPKKALAHIVDGGSYGRGGILLDRVLSGWASKSPADATQWVMEQPDSPLKDTAIIGTATGLARNNPDVATQFLMGLPEGDTKNQAAQTIFWQVLYKNGMLDASGWYDSIPPDQISIRQEIFRHISARQLLTGSPEAEEWVRQRQPVVAE